MDELKASVARIDERTLHMKDKINDLHSHVTQNTVSKSEFKPVRLITYGLVSLICIVVVERVLNFVLT